VRRNSGLYKVVHGGKSIIWYWEFDMKKQYFHQVKTIDYAAAVRFYEANKYTMWQEEEDESDTEDNQEDGEEEGERDFHQYASMEVRNSLRPKRMYKTRMAARMFGMAMAIPKTMTIS